MDGGRQLAWRSAVVPVPAKGRARVGPPGTGGTARDGTARGIVSPREAAIQAMVSWCEDGEQPVWLVEGLAGTGKTRLAADVADRVSAQLPCGWARPGLGGYAITAAARNARPALVLVDDGETRADMLELLDALTTGPLGAPIRVIVIARDFGSWWTDLLVRLAPEQRENLTAGRTALATDTVRGRAATTLAVADLGSAEVLLRQAALVVALSTPVGQLGPGAVRGALRNLFAQEQGYWRRALVEVRSPGQPPPTLRSALTSAAVLGPDGLAEAATVLRRVPALAVGAADRLARLAVLRPRLPSWLADRLPDGTHSSGISWTVAVLDAERRATSTLARMALAAHRDVWPLAASRSDDLAPREAAGARDSLRRAVAALGPVDEALAWLTQELELGDDELDALSAAISYPSQELSRTAIVIARRLLAAAVDAHTDGGLAGDERRAALTVVLGARYSEVGRWDEAREHTEEAVDTFRLLVDLDRARYLPDLAGAVSNLSSCLSQLGHRDAALTHSYEAVSLHRELVRVHSDGHLPQLARCLTNLAACLSRAHRGTAALGAASQAVGLYRELAAVNPTGYAAELAAAEHNLRVCRAVLGDSAAEAEPA